MKNQLLYISMALILGRLSVLAQENAAQEKNADSAVTPASYSTPPSSYSPSDIKVVGTLNSGQTSKPVVSSSALEYRALVFEGNGRDQVEVTLIGANHSGDNHAGVIALADSTLTQIASGTERLVATLPYHGPDTEAFYILFKSGSSQPAPVSVRLKKTPRAPVGENGSVQTPDATR
jgi:hypothetical protein